MGQDATGCPVENQQLFNSALCGAIQQLNLYYPDMHVGELIRKRREELGLSQAELGRRVGCSQQSIQSVENGETLKSRYLPRIAKILGLRLEDLDPGLHLDPTLPDGPILSNIELSGGNDLPLYSTTATGEGVFVMSKDPIEFVERPAPLARVKGAYGIIVAGELMEPEFRAGDIALVHPHLQPLAGETCVFFDKKRRQAIVARLTEITRADWVLRQWQAQEERRLPRENWTCERVVGKFYRR
jgi:transcriptional regulator with XRE-family HTH domain